MSASASRTISPSSLSRTRSTPWVLGWCGPMFSSIHSASGSCSGPNDSWVRTSFLTTDRVGLQPFELLIAEDHRLAKRDVILAQREPLPVRGHQDAAQVGVAVELDAEQVPGLPFVPAGGRPDRRQAGDVGVGHGRGGLDPDPGLLRQRAHLPDYGETRIASRPVDGRRVQEVIESLVRLEVAGEVHYHLRLDDDAEVAAEVGTLLQPGPEPVPDALHERVVRQGA